MNFKELLPWRKSENQGDDAKEVTVHRKFSDPFYDLQEHMNGVFKDFFRDFGSLDFPRQRAFDFSPSIDVKETEKEIVISAELPGIDKNDIDVSISRNTLTIRGEKRSETKNEEKGYQHIERSYGSFRRSVALPCEVVDDKADAVYKNGVLKITLPKTEKACTEKRKIDIKTS